jgi:pimeloyl-ACP methyl ester carboxylesterase
MDASSVRFRSSPEEIEFRSITFRGKDNLLIAAETCGAEGGQHVILLPGLGRTRRSWREAAFELAADGYRVTSIDLRGHGKSGWPKDEDYSLSALVDDLQAILRQQDGQPVLIGASIGGAAALMAASGAMRGEVAGLGLVDILPSVSRDGCSNFERFMAECERGFDTIDEASNKATRFFHAGLVHETPKEVQSSLRRGFDGRWYWHWDPATVRLRGDLSCNDLIRKAVGASSLFNVPTLLVTGAGGDRADQRFIDGFRALAPHLQWVDVSSLSNEMPRPAMQLAVPPLMKFIRMHWPMHRAEIH